MGGKSRTPLCDRWQYQEPKGRPLTHRTPLGGTGSNIRTGNRDNAGTHRTHRHAKKKKMGFLRGGDCRCRAGAKLRRSIGLAPLLKRLFGYFLSVQKVTAVQGAQPWGCRSPPADRQKRTTRSAATQQPRFRAAEQKRYSCFRRNKARFRATEKSPGSAATEQKAVFLPSQE